MPRNERNSADKPFLIDAGICGYFSSQSLATQKAEYGNGLLDYSVDLKEVREDKLFIENIRNIKSSNPHTYVIEDIVEFSRG